MLSNRLFFLMYYFFKKLIFLPEMMYLFKDDSLTRDYMFCKYWLCRYQLNQHSATVTSTDGKNLQIWSLPISVSFSSPYSVVENKQQITSSLKVPGDKKRALHL